MLLLFFFDDSMRGAFAFLPKVLNLVSMESIYKKIFDVQKIMLCQRTIFSTYTSHEARKIENIMGCTNLIYSSQTENVQCLCPVLIYRN